MAEQVEKQMEEMIPEFEEMERIGLLTPEELRVLVMKRRHFMYKLGAMSLSKKDILSYFEYETLLLELLTVRRKKERMFEKVDRIEHSIFRRIIRLLSVATRRFPHDLQLWEKRITFGKSINFPEVVWQAYKEMSQKHPRVLSVWVDWAQYEMTAFGNFEKAREILVSQAVLHHPGNKALFREIFRFELMYCEHLFHGRHRGDPANDGSVKVLSDSMKRVFQCDGARLVYQEAVTEHPDVNTAIEFYHVAAIFPFAAVLLQEIFLDICERFGDQAEVRLLKAEREALGLPVDCTDKEPSSLEVTTSADDADAGHGDADKSNDDSDTDNEKDLSDSPDADSAASGDNKLPPKAPLTKKMYLGPFRLYMAVQKQKKLKNEEIVSSVEDREAAIERLLESSHLSICPSPNKAEQSSMSKIPLLKRVGNLSLASSKEDGRLISLLVTEVLALMHHCWSCASTLRLLVDNFTRLCLRHQHLLSPQQLLVWAVTSTKFPDASHPQDVLETLERVCEGESPAACVYALTEMTRPAVAADDATLVRVFNAAESRLPEAWRHAALRCVLGALAPGPVRAGFLERHSSASCLDSGLVTSARAALLWAAHQETGLRAARAVYAKYEIFPPFCHELYATMCFLELGGDSSASLVRAAEQGGDVSASSDGQFVIDTEGDGESDGKEVDDEETDEEKEEEAEIEDEGIEEEEAEDDEGIEEEGEISEEEKEDEQEDQQKTNEESDSSSEEEQDSSADSDDSEDEIVLSRKLKKTKNKKKKQESSLSDDSEVDIEKIRNIFKTAIRLVGGSHHAVWLAYRQFEVKYGDTRSVALINTTAEHHMQAWCVHAFKNSILDIQHQRFVDESVVAEQLAPSPRAASDVTEPAKPAYLEQMPRNFLPPLSATQEVERDAFMGVVATINALSDDKPASPVTLGRTWYDVLTLLLDGKRILPRLRPESDTCPPTVPTDGQLNTNTQLAPYSGVKKASKKRVRSTTSLTLKAGEHCADAVRRHNRFVAVACRDPREDMDAMLAKSSTLKPEFLKKTELDPAVSKKVAKKLAKAERKKTAGKGWDYMKAPEMTPKIAIDIELLKMRGMLDPKQRFKSTHMKVTPKYFQMATVKNDPIHFYNRLTKKQRKSTLADEIINDQQIVSYQKRKFAQLVAKKESHRSKKQKTGEEFIHLSKNK